MVPVLSSTIVVTWRVCSRISGPLIRIPSCAPRPVPTISAVGVASPSAHGQAMITTATAAVNAAAALPPNASQPASVSSESAITIGTNTPETRSASRCTSRLARLRLRDQPRDLRQRRVGADPRRAHDQASRGVDRRARHLDRPRPTSTGTDSPVSIEASTADSPLSTTPSVAIFSPGRTTNRSPTRSCSTGTSTSSPSRSTRASLAPSSSSLRIASPERRFARASK